MIRIFDHAHRLAAYNNPGRPFGLLEVVAGSAEENKLFKLLQGLCDKNQAYILPELDAFGILGEIQLPAQLFLDVRLNSTFKTCSYDFDGVLQGDGE